MKSFFKNNKVLISVAIFFCFVGLLVVLLFANKDNSSSIIFRLKLIEVFISYCIFDPYKKNSQDLVGNLQDSLNPLISYRIST